MIRNVLSAYRVLAVTVLLYAAAAIAAFWYFDVKVVLRTSSIYVAFSLQLWLIVVLVGLLWQLLKLMRAGQDRPTLALFRYVRDWVATDGRGLHALAGYLLFMAMIYVFGAVKSTLPQFMPFTFDPLFVQIDRVLFLGTDPYRVLLPLFGGDVWLTVLNTAYQLWLVGIVVSITWVIFTRDHVRKLRYLFASLLAFVFAGSLMAVLLSSAGPCYYEDLFGGSEFEPLFAHLEAVHARTGTVWALIGQDILWQSHTQQDGLISGISAMPSMHNLFSWLWVFLVWPNRLLRAAMILFAGAIYVGSIVLGWHYAVDSLVGALLAWPCWTLSGRLTRVSLQGGGSRHLVTKVA